MTGSKIRGALQARYDRLWSEAIEPIRAGKLELDPLLAAGMPDPRRGLTLIGRPSPAVRQRVVAFLGQLRRLEPRQHYYAPPELHLTVLSLFTATADYRRFLARTEDYMAGLDAALRQAAPLRIEFRGVTVSTATVMVQGFVEDDALPRLRESLRAELRARGLAEGLDVRYRLETVHMTVVRFPAPLHNSHRFAAALERARQRSFGRTRLASPSVVENDWYMTHRVVEVLKRYPLP